MLQSNFARAGRFLRHRKRWRQQDLGERAGVSREMVSRLERGDLGRMQIQTVERVAAALGASVYLQLRWQGEQLDRLMDAAHASLQQSVAELLTKLGWIVRVEVSFNQYGDRGRVDVIAFHPSARVLLVVEVKTALGDLQETLGRIDVKARLARSLARGLGWTNVSQVVPALVIGDTRLARRVVADHAALFHRFEVRGRAALARLRRHDQPLSTGLLWFAKLPDSHRLTANRGGRVRKGPDSHAP